MRSSETTCTFHCNSTGPCRLYYHITIQYISESSDRGQDLSVGQLLYSKHRKGIQHEITETQASLFTFNLKWTHTVVLMN